MMPYDIIDPNESAPLLASCILSVQMGISLWHSANLVFPHPSYSFAYKPRQAHCRLLSVRIKASMIDNRLTIVCGRGWLFDNKGCWYDVSLNSSPPCATYMCQWTGSASVQVMACKAITWTNAVLLSIGLLGTNFSENPIRILYFSFKKMYLKMLSAKIVAILSRGRWLNSWRSWKMWVWSWICKSQWDLRDFEHFLQNCHHMWLIVWLL